MQRHCVGSKPQQLLLRLLVVWTVCILCARAAESSRSRTPSSAAVCPYRTINYITHYLAQQCLTAPPSALSSAKTTAVGSTTEKTSHTSIPHTTATSPALLQDYTSSHTADRRRPETDDAAGVRSTSPAGISEEDADLESPLGKDHFLSFEEWKRRNLDKYGQSADQIGKPKKHDNLQSRQQPINVLDTLGDDGEIDLDFSAFAAEKPQIAIPGHKDAQNAEAGGQNHGKKIPKTKSRSKDAGTTFKERFNYASFDCAATVLKTNTKSSGSSAVLVENKDSYMLNECSVANKFLILELCEDILIDTIVLANFEFFSSIFRTFRISVSDRYPLKLEKWKELGTFEARNSREVQAFLVENPLIWAKYVRIEFLTHYGNEFYCPLSLVRVHGTTMLEDYRHDEEPNKAEDREDEDDQATDPSESTETVIPEAVAEILVEEESSKTVAKQTQNLSDADPSAGNLSNIASETASSLHSESHSSVTSARDDLAQSTRNTNMSLFDPVEQCCLADWAGSDQTIVSSTARLSDTPGNSQTRYPSRSTNSTKDAADTPVLQPATNNSQSTIRPSSEFSIEHKPSEKYLSSKQASQTSHRSKSTNSPEKSQSMKQSAQASPRPKSTKSTESTGSDSSKPPASSTQPPPSNPTIQESFFKSVQKRLQMLESNSTLSLQYIEEQSRILRDAFSKVEQRQLAKTTKFLDYLNDTVLHELRDFRQQYDQLWQSTVLELETQREQSQRDAVAMNARLGILADELVFQKRMAILQSILVLLCIGLVLFPRGAVHSYLDHPLLQNMLTRSATLKMGISFLETPSLSPESTRPNSSYKMQAKAPYGMQKGHARILSEDSQSGINNPGNAYSPPTPASYDSHSETEDKEEDDTRHESSSPNSEERQRSRSSSRTVHHADDEPDTPTQTSGYGVDRHQSSPSPVAKIMSSNDESSRSTGEVQHTARPRESQRLPNG
jgi:Sad1 / UNC-like C-terminal